MPRVKIQFPNHASLYHAAIPVRITDINYGGHMGNDALLSILHEARIQCLNQWGYTELQAGGCSLIMADVMVAYKSEAFYGETLNIEIFSDTITEQTFDLLYKVTVQDKEKNTRLIAQAKTGMVSFDYTQKKIIPLSKELKIHLEKVVF